MNIESLYERYKSLTEGDSTAAATLVLAHVNAGCKTEPAPTGMLSVKQVAERLSVCEWTIRDLARSGKLICSRIGKGRGTLRFDPADVETFQRQTSGSPLPKNNDAKRRRLLGF